MPLYEYECDACGHRFEVIQKFSDPLADTCPKCGGGVHKLMSSPAIQFKGLRGGYGPGGHRTTHHIAQDRQRRHPRHGRQRKAHQTVDRNEQYIVGQEQALRGGHQPEVAIHYEKTYFNG